MLEEVAEVDTGDDFPVNEREYKFEELSERAKDTSRNWFHARWMGYQWWDTVYDDMEQLGEERGFDVDVEAGNRIAVGDQEGLPDDVFEFADVSRP